MSELNAAQFARLKTCFAKLGELPQEHREEALAALQEDAEVIAELRRMLAQTTVADEQYAKPVRRAIAELGADQLDSGATIGAWTLQDEIGSGGMGRVFRARRSDGHFDQLAAIKLLSGTPSAAALRLMARERQILANLNHPNIARLLDGGSTASGQPYFVMEYVDGVPIDQYAQQQRLNQSERINLIIEVCAAVAFAHQQLVIHCDLKPSNILVTSQGRPMLLDFGISRQLAAAGRAEEEGGSRETADPAASRRPAEALITTPAYTPGFASPEQVQAQRVGTATDLYSLGLVLAELLGARNDRSGLPVDLAAILAKATEQEPQQRYASASALAEDLTRYLRHEPVRARPPTTGYLAGRWLRRHWPWAAVASAFVLTVLLFGWQMMAERDAALKAERASRAIADYMIAVFQGADPQLTGERDVPVSKLLDAGRKRLESQLADQPTLRAELYTILGGVYQTIGQRNQAGELYDRAIAVLSEADAPIALASALHSKAYTEYDQEHFPAAKALAEQALALRLQHQPDSVELIASLRLLGSIHLYLREAEQARARLRSALSMAEALLPAQSLELARTHLAMARLHMNLDRGTQDAETHAKAAMQIIEQVHDREHYLYAEGMEMQMYGLAYRDQLDQALPIAEALSARRIALHGELSYQAGYALFAQADLLDLAGRRVEAIALLQRCIAIQEQLDGRKALSMSPPLNVLGYAQRNAGLYPEALASFRELLALRTSQLDEEQAFAAEIRLEIGSTLRRLGQLEQARALVEPVWAERRADPQTDPYASMKAELEMAALLRLDGELAQASEALDRIDDSAFDGLPGRRGYVPLERAKIAVAAGNAEAAMQHFLDAEQTLSALGEDHPELWLVRIHRAEFLAAQGQPQQAAELAAQIAQHAAPSIAAGGDWERRLDQLQEGTVDDG